MIDHKNKLIFIHIPKCGGSSFEIYFNKKSKRYDVPNYKNLIGWCPKRKIHLQHATAKQLLELDLIDENIWNSYTKISIIRNPYSRALSDYIWLMSSTGIRDSFINYILKKGKFSEILNNISNFNYRGDHLIPQYKFVYNEDELAVDHLIKLENIKVDFPILMKKLKIYNRPFPHSNKSKKFVKHYSHFFNDNEYKILRNMYYKDLQMFEYQFENLRNTKSLKDSVIIQLFKLFVRIPKISFMNVNN